MSYHDTMERVVLGFEVAGVAILVVGSLLAFVSATLGLRRGGGRTAYQRARQGVGRAILLGLEVLIIADIVLTITVYRTFDSALTLGLIVLVRTFLSFSGGRAGRDPALASRLDGEATGHSRQPWRWTRMSDEGQLNRRLRMSPPAAAISPNS
jgi:uncharacterized membrane protein